MAYRGPVARVVPEIRLISLLNSVGPRRLREKASPSFTGPAGRIECDRVSYVVELCGVDLLPSSDLYFTPRRCVRDAVAIKRRRPFDIDAIYSSGGAGGGRGDAHVCYARYVGAGRAAGVNNRTTANWRTQCTMRISNRPIFTRVLPRLRRSLTPDTCLVFT